MDALDCIEKRIDNLNRILGAVPTPNDPNASAANANAENLTDSLLSASTLLSSAMSGRDTITEFVQRTNELEKYLDPDFVDQQQDLRTKEVYVQALAPELVDTFQQLEQIKQLESTLGAEYFRTMPDVTDKLMAMNETTTELTQKNDLLEESLTLAMQRYDEIQSGLKDSLRSMSERLDRMEQRMQAKKNTDE